MWSPFVLLYFVHSFLPPLIFFFISYVSHYLLCVPPYFLPHSVLFKVIFFVSSYIFTFIFPHVSFFHCVVSFFASISYVILLLCSAYPLLVVFLTLFFPFFLLPSLCPTHFPSVLSSMPSFPWTFLLVATSFFVFTCLYSVLSFLLYFLLAIAPLPLFLPCILHSILLYVIEKKS